MGRKSLWTQVGLVLWGIAMGASPNFADPSGAISEAISEANHHSAAQRGRCLSLHMEEAMAINTARQPLYNRMSEGASQVVSKTLILSEGMALPMTRLMEWWAQPMVDLGVDLFCDVVVSMAGTPPMVESPQKLENEGAQGISEPFDSWKGFDQLGHYVWYAVTRSDTQLSEVIAAQLGRLHKHPSTHCMQRHLLESILRAVNWAPVHRQTSQQIGFGFRGAALVQVNILSQISLLPLGFWLDHQAYPVQKQGIPLICGDVPPIPPR